VTDRKRLWRGHDEPSQAEAGTPDAGGGHGTFSDDLAAVVRDGDLIDVADDGDVLADSGAVAGGTVKPGRVV